MKRLASTLVLTMIALSFYGCNSNDSSIVDKTTFSDSDVIEYLQEQGFEFSAREGFTGAIKRISVSHKDGKIVLQKYSYEDMFYVMYTYRNSSINYSFAYINGIYKNSTDDMQNQFYEYEKWLEHHNLTTKQIINALDYFERNVTEYEKMMW